MTHDRGPLPEDDRQDSLHQLSLNALRNLLPRDKFLICDERVDDKGVDVALEAKLAIREESQRQGAVDELPSDPAPTVMVALPVKTLTVSVAVADQP